jgi:replication factor C large subunit
MDLTAWIDNKVEKEPAKDKELPWFEKYKPSKIEEVAGNVESISEICRWFDNPNKKEKALLITGPTGSGKSTIVYALARTKNIDIIELSSLNKRTKELIHHIAGFSSQTISLSGRKKLILVEEVDTLSGIYERGAIDELKKVITETKIIVIFTANDPKSKRLGPIRRYCKHIELKKINVVTIAGVLRRIAEKEKISLSNEAIQYIAENADGDLRAAINDLQSNCGLAPVCEKRNKEINIFNALRGIFKAKSYAECRKILFDLNEEPGTIMLWLDENIPSEYRTRREIKTAYQQLSNADHFFARISKQQYWGFLRYVNDLCSVGIAFSKERQYTNFVPYRFPAFIQKLGAIRGKRAVDSEIAKKLSKVMHTSQKDIITNYLPLIEQLRNYAPEKAEKFLEH